MTTSRDLMRQNCILGRSGKCNSKPLNIKEVPRYGPECNFEQKVDNRGKSF